MDELDAARERALVKVELINQLVKTQTDYAKHSFNVVSPEEATVTVNWLKQCQVELNSELKEINKQLGIQTPYEKRHGATT